MYPVSVGAPSDQSEGKPRGGKVDLVCTAVREVLTEMGENQFLLSIITSYVKMSRPDLETVLSMIQKLKGECRVGVRPSLHLVGLQRHKNTLRLMRKLPLPQREH